MSNNFQLDTQHIFPGEAKNFVGRHRPLATGLVGISCISDPPINIEWHLDFPMSLFCHLYLMQT